MHDNQNAFSTQSKETGASDSADASEDTDFSFEGLRHRPLLTGFISFPTKLQSNFQRLQ
jgi:hypothetical protein